MYNIKDILNNRQKGMLKKDNINYDVIINNEEEMKNYISILFDNLTGFNNIQEISDLIVDYHNNHNKKRENNNE